MARDCCTSVRLQSQNRPGPRMGMGHYEMLLIQHLLKQADPNGWQFEFEFDGRKNGVEVSPDDLAPGLAGAAFVGFSTSRLSRVPFFAARSVMRLREIKPTRRRFYHSLSLAIPAPAGRAYVSTIHDLPPARFPDEGTIPAWATKAAHGARAILTPSQFAKGELIELLGVSASRVHVVPNGCVHDRFHPQVAPATPQQLEKLGLRAPFLLYTGGFTIRKNVAALLESWRQIAQRYPEISLALAGPAQPLQAIVDRGGVKGVALLGYLTHEELPAVMKAAEALVVPSIYEGFGLPPLEAMAVGTPVVAVRAGAIPEVVGDCAVLAPDGSAEAIAAAVCRLLDDPALAARLRREGPRRAAAFSWEDHAASVLRIYQMAFC